MKDNEEMKTILKQQTEDYKEDDGILSKEELAECIRRQTEDYKTINKVKLQIGDHVDLVDFNPVMKGIVREIKPGMTYLCKNPEYDKDGLLTKNGQIGYTEDYIINIQMIPF